ncbi:MAG: hypothetical protein ACYDAA_05110 [Syntrophales bacterium]
MKIRRYMLPLLVFSFAVSFSSLCGGEDNQPPLTVKKIAFTRDKGGGERISLFCNRACAPELSSIEEALPRVVMDMKGVFLMQAKARTVNTGGKFVKRVRSYLDKETRILRVVLDMDPSKYYVVRPLQDLSGKTYVLTINERSSLSEQEPQANKGTTASPLSPKQRIYLYRSDLRPGKQQEGTPQGAALGPERRKEATAVTYVQSMNQGRSQLNAGEYVAAVETFTGIIAAHPQDSLGYRLRGNAYDNLGDRQKALEDWIQAARRGDTILQSYLDFLQVVWREHPAQ